MRIHTGRMNDISLPLVIMKSANQPPNIELGIVTTQGTTLNTQPWKQQNIYRFQYTTFKCVS